MLYNLGDLGYVVHQVLHMSPIHSDMHINPL